MKIVADKDIPFLKGVLDPFAEIIYLPGKEIGNEILRDADAIIIRTRTKCTETLLKGTGVRFIGTATIGFDHIDTQYCKRNNIAWTNAPGCNSSSVQQYIAAALLKMASEFRMTLTGKTIGIVGVGNVGSKVAGLAEALGLNVLLNDPPRARKERSEEFVSLGNILYGSDIITVHVPLNVVGEDNTYHLFNSRSFRKMKKGTWFINTSRGEVVETAAVKKVLNTGKLGGAILDVWENEPDIDLELMKNTFLSTPHIAGYSADGKANGTSIVVNSLSRFFNFPLKDWYPENIPLPENQPLYIDCEGKNDQEIIAEAVERTYDVDEDNIKFRFSPSGFERQRNEYRIRREFAAFDAELSADRADAAGTLRRIGFKSVRTNISMLKGL